LRQQPAAILVVPRGGTRRLADGQAKACPNSVGIPQQLSASRIRGGDGEWRIRVGDCRVEVTRIRNRSVAYCAICGAAEYDVLIGIYLLREDLARSRN
jgi:hypothetical protein